MKIKTKDYRVEIELSGESFDELVFSLPYECIFTDSTLDQENIIIGLNPYSYPKILIIKRKK